MNSEPLSQRILSRTSTLCDDPGQSLCDVAALEAGRDVEREALTSKIIDYGQKTDLAAVRKVIRHEVHRPRIIYDVHDRAFRSNNRRLAAARRFEPHGHAFFAIDAVDALAIEIVSQDVVYEQQ